MQTACNEIKERNINVEKITLIVPIYNVEDYLGQCLDSIQNQTYKNFICIMVNDGSTDNSKEIAENYLTDERFILINQENKGLSGARNTGLDYLFEKSIEQQMGNYVSFIDSDDVISPGYLEYFVANIEPDVDIIEANIHTFFDDDTPIFSNDEKKSGVIIESVKEKLISQLNKAIRVSIFPRLINKRVLSTQFFPEGKIFEDLAVMPILIKESKKWKKLPKEIYGYRVRKGSITNAKFSRRNLDIFPVLNSFKESFKTRDDEEKILVEKIRLDQFKWHYRTFVPEKHYLAPLYLYNIFKIKIKLKICSKI